MSVDLLTGSYCVWLPSCPSETVACSTMVLARGSTLWVTVGFSRVVVMSDDELIRHHVGWCHPVTDFDPIAVLGAE